MLQVEFIFAKKSITIMGEKQHIKTPEGVAKLLEELWIRHKAGIKQPENNVFWVDFPPPTDEELVASRRYIADLKRKHAEEDNEDGL